MNTNSNLQNLLLKIKDETSRSHLQSMVIQWQQIAQTFAEKKSYSYFEYIEAIWKRVFLELMLENFSREEANSIRKYVSELDKVYYEMSVPLDGYIKLPNSLVEAYFFARMPLGADRHFKDEIAGENICIIDDDYFKNILYPK